VRALLPLLVLSCSVAHPRPLGQLRSLAASPKLQSKAAYLQSVRNSQPIFARQGGLVSLPPDVPTVILPDLHAQRDYLLQALQTVVNGRSVYAGLQAGKLNLLCLGDGMHSEGRARERWIQAERDLLAGRRSAAMDAEMTESLGLLQMVMELKTAFPKHFYFVRGNHEDMDPSVPYGKFVQSGESNLVKHWTLQRFGADFLRDWSSWERCLPLVAVGGSFVASHSPPEERLDLREVRERSAETFRPCCWSDNTLWVPGGPQQNNFEFNCRLLKVTAARPWIAGHRKVEGTLYRSQVGGRLIQINPMDSAPRVFAVAPAAGKAFSAARDIRVLQPNSAGLPASPP
jgi:hypothetical protein